MNKNNAINIMKNPNFNEKSGLLCLLYIKIDATTEYQKIGKLY